MITRKIQIGGSGQATSQADWDETHDAAQGDFMLAICCDESHSSS